MPKFKCWTDEEEDAKDVEASSSAKAAEDYISDEDDGSFSDVVQVFVRADGDDPEVFSVCIAHVVTYTATRKR